MRKTLRDYCAEKGQVLIQVSPCGTYYAYDLGPLVELVGEVPEEYRI